jgi:hypothetical protein
VSEVPGHSTPSGSRIHSEGGGRYTRANSDSLQSGFPFHDTSHDRALAAVLDGRLAQQYIHGLAMIRPFLLQRLTFHETSLGSSERPALLQDLQQVDRLRV